LTRQPLHLFEGYGIELEYMIVDQDSLSVRPIADELLRKVAGHDANEVDREGTGWSNELASHVIEMKTGGPAPSLLGLEALFQRDVADLDALLAPMGARLMPSAMHPWMDPFREMRLYPGEYNAVYATFDRIFDCRGHGWSNLQSMHINLPFDGDDEFGRLHAAIRLILPILPALAASSPVKDGAPTGLSDTRLAVYKDNARKVPSVSGKVIPERVFTRAEYDGLLRSIWKDLEPHDPDGILSFEWVNARGAIARFDRMAIEIRVLDIQECPRADIAIAGAITSVLKAIVAERFESYADQKTWDEVRLLGILDQTLKDGSRARITDLDYLAALGLRSGPLEAGEVWTRLLDGIGDVPASWREVWAVLASHGTLSERIMTALGDSPSPRRLKEVYRQLCECLAAGRLFVPDAA